jgi:hypothetical protein
MTRRLVGAVASCLALLAGMWLILSPFALGVQPDHGDWKDETFTDVWSGIGLGAVGLIGMIVFAAALARSVRAQPQPLSAPEEEAPAPAAPAPSGQAPSSDLDKLLAPLIAALTSDLNREHDAGSTNGETEYQTTRQRAIDPGATR